MPRLSRLTCAVEDCEFSTYDRTINELRRVQFFALPSGLSNRDRRSKWIKWLSDINGENWEVCKYSHVCSLHFIGGKPSNMLLHPAYAPSIKTRDDYTPLEEKIALAEFEIYKKQKIANMKKRYNMLSLNPNKVTGINHCASQNSCAVIQKDVGVQVWHEDISKQDKSFLFVCNSFIDNNKNHAEIQVYIPEGTGSMRLVRYKKAKNKCCGTEVKFANKSVECTASTLLSVSRWLYGIDKLEQESNDR
ncbi:uncharacterized protein LOC113386768 [Ctenocephalides felis]|uniref:uncharacterized protein LOC113386768 n=1 Tax=Ctenocephalides felis TaxID=7515 RepID=UPI000E6E2211|nr:uncharacterized protein LOC113386768 [Ctenocephalides felis]